MWQYGGLDDGRWMGARGQQGKIFMYLVGTPMLTSTKSSLYTDVPIWLE